MVRSEMKLNDGGVLFASNSNVAVVGMLVTRAAVTFPKNCRPTENGNAASPEASIVMK